MKSITLRSLLVMAVALSFTLAARAQDDWTRNFRAGLLMGVNIKADFKTSGQFSLTGNDPGQPGAGGNHHYDDGYVLVDDGGATPLDYYTSNWGGTSYDPSLSTLTFHSTHDVSLTSAQSRSDDSPYLGVDLAYGGTF